VVLALKIMRYYLYGESWDIFTYHKSQISLHVGV
jgi:hypothetical protein